MQQIYIFGKIKKKKTQKKRNLSFCVCFKMLKIS